MVASTEIPGNVQMLNVANQLNIEPENVEPVYTEFKGWAEDLTEMSEASTLPKELNEYMKIFIL